MNFKSLQYLFSFKFFSLCGVANMDYEQLLSEPLYACNFYQ
jgi:hypothetical protein